MVTTIERIVRVYVIPEMCKLLSNYQLGLKSRRHLMICQAVAAATALFPSISALEALTEYTWAGGSPPSFTSLSTRWASGPFAL